MKTTEKKENWHDAVFAAKAEIVVSTKDGPEPALKEVNFNLIVPDQDTWVDKKAYLVNDVVTPAGVKVLTNIFIQALVGNIKAAHSTGTWGEKAHFEFVCLELGRAMAADSEISAEENYFRTKGDQLVYVENIQTKQVTPVVIEKTTKIPQFEKVKFPTPEHMEAWLESLGAKNIVLQDKGQDMQLIKIYRTGEILDTDFNGDIYVGKFVNVDDLVPGEFLQTWNNETGKWDIYRGLIIEAIH
jgi:hypothetical protein